MRPAAIPARVAVRARRARPWWAVANFRLSPHRPSRTRLLTQQIPATAEPAPADELVRVLVLGYQRQGSLEQDEEVEQHRPVLDVIEIELDALLDLFLVVDFAAPAVDLSPAGDARLDAMPREVAVDGLVEQPALQLALH